MFKKLIGAIYLLLISSLSFATGISTMMGRASLSDTTTNWNPAFADGNTIVVGADNISLITDVSKTIGAIRLDNTLSHIGYYAKSTASPTIGSIAGKAQLTLLETAGPRPGQIWTLTGTAGVDNNPRANDYSGLSSIRFTYNSTLNINAPVTINSTFSTSNHLTTNLNINNNLIITHNSIANIGKSTFIIAPDKSLTLSGSDMTLTSTFDFGDSGILNLSGDNTKYNPSSVSKVTNAILNINNNVTTNMPSVLTINTINIADGKSFTIDAVNSDIDLLDNNTSINFSGSSASLVLTNSSNADRILTLFTNLNPSTTTNDYGIVRVGATTHGLTIANNKGPYTIGQDNTHRLENFIVEGAGSIIVDNTVFAKLLSMNSTGQATFNQALDLGAEGGVAFGSSGTLIADVGITGNIDFAGQEGVLRLADSQKITGNVDSTNSSAGTLEFLGKGTVTGSIGATNALKALKFSGAGATTIPAANAATIEVANAGAVVTASALLTGNVLFNSDGSLIANKGVDGSVTTSIDKTGTITIGSGDVGAIGTDGKSLKLVNLNQPAAASAGKLYATTVNIGGAGPITATDLVTSAVSFSSDGKLIVNGGITGHVDFAGNEGILQLADGKTITGNVESSAASAGTLEFLGKGTVTGSIGATNALTALKFSGTGAITIPAANAKTIEVANDSAVVTASALLTGNVLFNSDGSLIANKGVDGSVTTRTDKTGTITIGSGDVGAIGTDGKSLKLVNLNQPAAASAGKLYATTVNIGGAGPITATDLITSAVSFSSDGKLIVNGGITGHVDFAGNEAVINISDGKEIIGDVKSNGGNIGVINFEGHGTMNGSITNLTMLKAGAGDVTFKAAGDYSITELQGNGDGTVIFPSGMQYIGGINITGGNPVNLSFADNNTINGNIGSNSSPVGNISSATTTEFNGDINSNGDIITSGKTSFAGNVACNNILANTVSSDALSSFSLFAPLTTNVRNTINFDQENVITKFQGTVYTKSGIKVSGSTYFADTVNSGGNVVINGDTKFNKTLSSNNDISISSGSNVIFNGDVSSSSINIDNVNIGVTDNIEVQGNVSASNSSILLDGNTLTLFGIHTFSDQITISSTYDESSLSGGNIILQSGSTLDLSNVSELMIKLAFINSDISNITNDTQYNIILAEDGSNIVLLSDPENQVILDSSGEQNRFVKWTLDASSLTLYASDDSDNVIDNDYVFDSVQNNTFMQELKNASSDSLAQEFKKNIGLLSKEQVEDMFARILAHPKERSSDIVRVALHQALTDTNRSAMNVIHGRLLDTGPSHATASAGDEDVSQYGVWVRSSINQSKEKVNSKRSEYFSSYKTRGHSNTIGVDGLICDNLLVGAAYTNAYTSIRPKDQNIGNVDKVSTNMFSLYGAYNIPNYDWYLDGTVSYAESSVRGKKIRYLGVARDMLGSEVASSKYKSRLYSGSVSLGYNHYIGNNAYVTPSIGAIGSLIRDRGYTESGPSFQNLTVGKKHYNKLSGNAGLRTYQNIYVDNNVGGMIVTPEAYGFVNYNIKNKTPAIDARLAGIDERLPTISHRSHRVDYNLGLGLTIKQNMMEYGINYDANLAKKYQGHSGSLKVRVNL